MNAGLRPQSETKGAIRDQSFLPDLQEPARRRWPSGSCDTSAKLRWMPTAGDGGIDQACHQVSESSGLTHQTHPRSNGANCVANALALIGSSWTTSERKPTNSRGRETSGGYSASSKREQTCGTSSRQTFLRLNGQKCGTNESIPGFRSLLASASPDFLTIGGKNEKRTQPKQHLGLCSPSYAVTNGSSCRNLHGQKRQRKNGL